MSNHNSFLLNHRKLSFCYSFPLVMSLYHALSLRRVRPDIHCTWSSSRLGEFQPPYKGFSLGIGYAKNKGLKFDRERWDDLYKTITCIAHILAQPGGDFGYRNILVGSLDGLVIGPSPTTIQLFPWLRQLSRPRRFRDTTPATRWTPIPELKWKHFSRI